VEEPDTEALAQKIQEDPRWELIYDKILRQRPAVPCELIPLYFAGKNGLLTNDIYSTLKILGRTILPTNIARDLPKKGGKYVTKSKEGKNYRFTINPTGKSHIEQIIQ
jgi:hypothetical protein